MIWATLQNEVDSEDPTSLLDQENLGCTQRAAQVYNRMVMEKQILFRSKPIRTILGVFGIN